MLGLCQYSKKVADEYPWTQAVPDDPHSVDFLKFLPKGFLKFGNCAVSKNFKA